MPAQIISKETAFTLGIVATMLTAVFLSGVAYNKLLSLEKKVDDMFVQQQANTQLLNRIAGSLGVDYLSLK